MNRYVLLMSTLMLDVCKSLEFRTSDLVNLKIVSTRFPFWHFSYMDASMI